MAKTRGTNANSFELFILKHDHDYLSVDSDESMRVIMKCNTA